MKAIFAGVLSLCAVAVQAGVLLHIPFCPEQVGVQTYAHPDLCDHFFLCTNGSVTVEQCENGLLFDGKGSVHKHCNYNWAVDCGARKYEDVPISSPGCLYQFGIYPESASCSTNYIKCESGVAHQTPCEPGLAYDDKTHSCNWPDLLLDTCNPEAILGFKCPTKLPSNTVAAKFWPFPRFAIPGDCGRLITCVNNFPRLISCGDNKVFDEESLTFHSSLSSREHKPYSTKVRDVYACSLSSTEHKPYSTKVRDVYAQFIARCLQQNTSRTALKYEVFMLGIVKVEYRRSEPAFAWRESGKPFRKTTPSSPNRDSNSISPSSAVKLNTTSALANYATEAG
uniref:Chitin-binding type-2 domain-containing protein n=1 Tax=Timema tahoe TaxID=61484 RepID=A0A7R9FHC8_9NEOP|nr:unnamed protein product [Timema tahoe]